MLKNGLAIYDDVRGCLPAPDKLLGDAVPFGLEREQGFLGTGLVFDERDQVDAGLAKPLDGRQRLGGGGDVDLLRRRRDQHHVGSLDRRPDTGIVRARHVENRHLNTKA